MKYKIILVDDEEIYLQYMKTMIPWEKYQCEICGCAQNGNDALRLAEEINPDIIFMDIDMAQMNGLEASSILREEKNTVKIIIMTAHDEFNLAQKAIKLKVDDYLLKPFDEDELINSLNQCLKQIEEERKQKQDKLEGLLLRLLNNEETDVILEIPGNDQYMVGLFQKNAHITSEEKYRIDKRIDYYFNKFGIHTNYLGNFQGSSIVVHQWSSNLSEKENIKEIYRDFQKECTDVMIEWMALGSVVCSPVDLYKSYQDALLVKQNRIKFRDEIISYEDLKQLNRKVDVYSAQDITALISELELKNYQNVDEILKRMFAISNDNLISFQYAIATYYSIITQMYEYYHMQTMHDMILIDNRASMFIQDIDSCATGGQMLEIIKNYVYEVYSDCISIPVGSKKEILVKKIEAYLQKHYTEQDFSIQRLADELFFENSYIRRIFKMHTGETIFQRLESIRINKAKELLREGIYKTSEIAEMTGYGELQYFSRRFKFVCGCTPSQYRKSIRHE